MSVNVMQLEAKLLWLRTEVEDSPLILTKLLKA